MNKPNLVDSKLIENLINKCKNNSVRINPIQSIKNVSFMEILKTYWLLLIILVGVIIFIVYHYKKDNKVIKESFTNKKLKKRRKVDKYISDEGIPPMQYPNQIPSVQMKPKEKSKCLTCKDDRNIDYKQLDDPYTDQPYIQEPQYVEQVQYEQPAHIPHQVEQPIETNYENQFYGQAITDEVNNVGNNIESFNSTAMGNFVAF